MSFKITYPPGITIINTGTAVPGSFIQHVSIPAMGPTPTLEFAAGTILERITITDSTNPAPLITVTSPDDLTEYSSLDVSGGYGIDLLDFYCAVATTIKFNNLTAASIGSVRYYRHPQ